MTKSEEPLNIKYSVGWVERKCCQKGFPHGSTFRKKKDETQRQQIIDGFRYRSTHPKNIMVDLLITDNHAPPNQ